MSRQFALESQIPDEPHNLSDYGRKLAWLLKLTSEDVIPSQKCTHCQEDIFCENRLVSCPEILVVLINRWNKDDGEKLNCGVDIPTVGFDIRALIFQPMLFQMSPTLYNLQATVRFSGTDPSNGHYVFCALESDTAAGRAFWAEYNGSERQGVSEEKAKISILLTCLPWFSNNQSFPKGSEDSCILLYRRTAPAGGDPVTIADDDAAR